MKWLYFRSRFPSTNPDFFKKLFMPLLRLTWLYKDSNFTLVRKQRSKYLCKGLTTNISIKILQFGLDALFISIKEQPGAIKKNVYDELMSNGLFISSDRMYLFPSLAHLKQPLIYNNRLEIAVSATSFFLFLRIFYHSSGSLMNLLFKALNPSDSVLQFRDQRRSEML